MRIRELVKAGEFAMRPAPVQFATETGIEQLNICEKVEKPKKSFTLYSTVIDALHALTGVCFEWGYLTPFTSNLRSL